MRQWGAVTDSIRPGATLQVGRRAGLTWRADRLDGTQRSPGDAARPGMAAVSGPPRGRTLVSAALRPLLLALLLPVLAAAGRLPD